MSNLNYKKNINCKPSFKMVNPFEGVWCERWCSTWAHYQTQVCVGFCSPFLIWILSFWLFIETDLYKIFCTLTKSISFLVICVAVLFTLLCLARLVTLRLTPFVQIRSMQTDEIIHSIQYFRFHYRLINLHHTADCT